jgi:hypothetical protein
LFAGGITQLFVGAPQEFVVATQVLSVLFTQVSCGWLQMLSVPLQVWAEKIQVCAPEHLM